MDKDKFYELQCFLEEQATQAWWKTQRDPYQFRTAGDTLGHNLELQLQINSQELDKILNHLAQNCVEEALADIQDDPIDFNRYTRPSSQPGYKEVFVGEKWVVVPENTCVDFAETSVMMPNGSFDQGFKVTLYQEGTSDWAQFETSLTMVEYEEQLIAIEGNDVDVTLQPAQFQDQTGMWEEYGRPILQTSQKQTGFADDLFNGSGYLAGDSFLKRPSKVRRNYSYKVTKKLNKLGADVRHGTVHRNMTKMAKLGRSGKLASLTKVTKVLGPVGNILTGGVIIDEIFISKDWDAHTVVDGALLVVGIIAAGAGAPVVLAGIAIYGIVDYFFGVGEGLDNLVGKDSGLWDERIQKAPIDRDVLFQRAVDNFEKNSPFQPPEVEIDNTRVKNPIRIKPNFKN